MNKMKYIYGPVCSWRLGSSLGIDLIGGNKKICTFDCIYCQIGKTYKFTDKRKIYVPTEKIIKELKSLPSVKIDYLTFSGMGEPTMASNLGEVIESIRKLRKEKIAVLTNSSLIYRDDVIEDLLLADFVIFKLDAYSIESFKKINKPMDSIKFDSIFEGIKKFKTKFSGKLGLQIMFTKENKERVKDILKLVQEILPDEVQINTPLRPSKISPLSEKEISKITKYFTGTNFISVYGKRNKQVTPIDFRETVKRRGIIQ